MTKISGIGTTLATQSEALYIEAEKADGTSGKLPANLIGLINIRTITATGAGTYTPTAGTKSILIQLQGAGGGGAGVASPGASNNAFGNGGASGAYLEKRLTANFSGASYSVGAKGAGGAAGANNGANGGDTTFTDTAGSPTTYTAEGGDGGFSNAASSSFPRVGGNTAVAAATNGDLNVSGGYPTAPLAATQINIISGGGGPSQFSGGGIPSRLNGAAATSAGSAAGGKGGGGSGGVATTTGAAAAGGDGSDGFIRIWEFSN